MGWVLGGLVEVDDAVEDFAGTEKGVDYLADLFPFGVVVGRASVWVKGRGDYFDSASVGAGGDLLISPDKLFGADFLIFMRRKREEGTADVVGADCDDEVFCAGLSEDIAINTGEGAGTGDVMQEPSTTDAFVDDSYLRCCFVALQPLP